MKNFSSKYEEFLRKGYILTNNLCPNCGKILLKDPKTNLLFCPNCGYREDKTSILDDIEERIIGLLKNSKNAIETYYLLKSLYIINKLKEK